MILTSLSPILGPSRSRLIPCRLHCPASTQLRSLSLHSLHRASTATICRRIASPTTVWTRLHSTAPSAQSRKSIPSSSKAKVKSKERFKPAIDSKDFALPERLIIYHAGAGRVSFLAMFKVTSLLVGAFFCFAVGPAYYSSDKADISLESLGPALCGVIPVLLIAYTTSPFVTHMHLHLPPAARVSRPALERFVHAVPPSTPLTITTISPIGKPRYSKMQVGHLRPQRSRFGLVNYVRDHNDQEKTARKWYNFRAINKFYVQDDKAVATARKQSKVKKSPVEWWIWDEVRGKMAKREAQEKATGRKA